MSGNAQAVAAPTITALFGRAHHLQRLGRLPEAESVCREILAIDPRQPRALHLLGTMAHQVGQHQIAAALIHKAIALEPDNAVFHSNLGLVLESLGRVEAALASLEQALHLAPGFADAHNNRGGVLLLAGQVDEAEASFRRALALDPDHSRAHSNLLLSLHYGDGHDRQTLLAEARAWGRRHADHHRPPHQAWGNRPDPSRRLRVGYVSGDFRRHSVGYLLDAILPSHDRSQVDLICYTNDFRVDELTERLQSVASEWHSLVGMGDAPAAEKIRADRIDILIDLSGHTAGHRLQVFARKSAPIQVTWMGYPDTTGVAAIDYILLDGIVCNEGDEDIYVERVVRLPDAYIAYAPSASAPSVATPPGLAGGPLTFGSFNNLAKVTPRVVAVWAEILRALPDARFLLKAAPLSDASVVARYAALFAAAGIDPARLDFVGKTTQADLFRHYGRVDIALDPFPYNGCVTTLEALWMGVPLVSLSGDGLVSRVGETLLASIGLRDLVARSPAEYVQVAVDLARAESRRAQLRATLRGTLAGSPLCDGPRLARNLEAAYREMWVTWCRTTGLAA